MSVSGDTPSLCGHLELQQMFLISADSSEPRLSEFKQSGIFSKYHIPLHQEEKPLGEENTKPSHTNMIHVFASSLSHVFLLVG